ncbi:MAG: copper transport protein, partial [Cryptosporangiaceae bacterium]|nr:copper transport protein [Cryptosporangiaceae bacterium]
LGLSVLLGGCALATLGPARIHRSRLLTVAAGGGGLALLAGPALLAAQVYTGTGELGAVFGRELTGGRWLAGELGCLVLTAVAWWARPGGRPKDSTAAAIVLGVGGAVSAATGYALLGHGGSWPGAAATAVHVLAAGAWAGSVLAVALVLTAARIRREPLDLGGLLRAFAVLAVAAVAALTVTGLLLTAAEVASVDALITTPYGLLLIGKVALTLAAGLLGLRTSLAVRRSGVPRRAVGAEAVALAAVLGLAAALASAGPARGPQFSAEPGGRIVPQVSGQVADLVDTVAVRPNRPGRNVVSVRISDTRRPAPGRVTGVSIVLRAPDGTQTVRPAARATDGSWTAATDDVRAPGAWTVSVTVLREGVQPVTDAHGWTVAAGQPPRRILSTAPLRPALTWLAATLALLGAIAGVLWLTRRRAVTPDSPDRVPVAAGSR